MSSEDQTTNQKLDSKYVNHKFSNRNKDPLGIGIEVIWVYYDGENLCAVMYLDCGMTIWARFTV